MTTTRRTGRGTGRGMVTPDGLMAGWPPPPGRLVTLANWQEPPFNRWAYLHVRELMPTARIGRGDRPVTELARADRSEAVERLKFRFQGTTHTVGETITTTFTDGFLVIHEGRIVAERYANGMTPSTTHLLQSVSKSLTGALAGVLVGEGRLATGDLVTDHVTELRGTSFEGCTVADLLDMRAGTRFSEDYEDPAADIRISEQVSGWRPRTLPHLPASLYEYMAGLENARPHGGPFEYRSILTDVLGWVLERAGGASFARLFSEHVWSRLGAEYDAEVTVDACGCALEDGSICTTLRDLGRFGLLQLEGGVLGGRQVVPAGWIERLRRPDLDLIAAFGPPVYRSVASAELMYHDQWWVLDPRAGIQAALGIHGQMLFIHGPSRTVVVKLSTQPRALDRTVSELQLTAAKAIGEALGAGSI